MIGITIQPRTKVETQRSNHVGGPLAIGPYAGKREEAFTEWRDRIRKIAALPNTYVKLGGLGMKMIGFTFYENPDPPSSQDLEKAWRPDIETCTGEGGRLSRSTRAPAAILDIATRNGAACSA